MDFSILYPQHSNLCCFDPRSVLLAVAVGSKIVLREADTLRILRKLSALGNLSHIEFSPDSRYLLGASYALGTLEVWPVHSASIAASAEGHYCSTSVLACESSGSSDAEEGCHPVPQGALGHLATRHDASMPNPSNLGVFARPAPDVAVAVIDEGLVGCARAAWHPTRRCVLSWSGYGMRLGIWSLLDRQMALVREPKHVNAGAAFRCDGRYLAVLERADCKDIIGIYDGFDLFAVKRFPIGTADAADLAWSPDGRYIAVWDSALEYMVEIYTPDGRLVKSYVAYENNLGVRCASWSPNSLFLAIGSYDQKVRLLNSLTFSVIAEFEVPASISVLSRRSPSGSKSTTLFRENGCAPAENQNESTAASRWPFNSATRTWSGYEKPSPPFSATFPTVKPDPENPTKRVGVGAMVWSRDGLLLAVKNDSVPNVISIYSMMRLQREVVLQHKDAVRHFAWHPQAPRKLAVCTGTKNVYFWSASANEALSKGVESPTGDDAGDAVFISGTEESLENNSVDQAMFEAEQSEDTQDDLQEADVATGLEFSGVAEVLPVPEPEFRVNGFFWSPDGKRMILMDKANFCVGFEIRKYDQTENETEILQSSHQCFDNDYEVSGGD